MKDNLMELLGETYAFLLIDQDEAGLWSRTLTIESEAFREERNRRSISEALTVARIESITITWLAVDAIIGFTHNSRHPAVIRAVRALLSKRGPNGVYGSLTLPPRRVGVPKHPLYNARHTAGAVLLLLRSQSGVQSRDGESIRALLALQHRDDQAWGDPGEDPLGEPSECLSTALSLEALYEVAGGPDVPRGLATSDIQAAASRGLGWLKSYSEQAKARGWWRTIDDHGPIEDTAYILGVFSHLESADKDLYSRMLERLRHEQREDHGWPQTEGSVSSLGSTILCLRALARSKDRSSREAVSNGIEYVLRELGKPSVALRLDVDHWASLLSMARPLGVFLEPDEDAAYAASVDKMRVIMMENPDGVRDGPVLPTNFGALRPEIARILTAGIGSTPPSEENRTQIGVELPDAERRVE